MWFDVQHCQVTAQALYFLLLCHIILGAKMKLQFTKWSLRVFLLLFFWHCGLCSFLSFRKPFSCDKFLVDLLTDQCDPEHEHWFLCIVFIAFHYSMSCVNTCVFQFVCNSMYVYHFVTVHTRSKAMDCMVQVLIRVILCFWPEWSCFNCCL